MMGNGGIGPGVYLVGHTVTLRLRCSDAEINEKSAQLRTALKEIYGQDVTCRQAFIMLEGESNAWGD